MNDLEELKNQYLKTKAPHWLLQDTMQKADQSVPQNIISLATPIVVGVAAMLAILIFMPPESDTPRLKSPSFSSLQLNTVRPDQFRVPSLSSMKNLPSVPKTPKIPKDKNHTSIIFFQDSFTLSKLPIYKEVNKHV